MRTPNPREVGSTPTAGAHINGGTMITDVHEAIGHMGKENVVTPALLDSLNFPQKFDRDIKLRIPEKFMDWKGSSTREVRRKIADTANIVPNTIREYHVKEIYYPQDRHTYPDHPNRGYELLKYPEQKKRWQFWREDLSIDDKIALWNKMRRNTGEFVWLVYDEPVENTCPFALIPGIPIDTLTLMYKFDHLIDEHNNPYHWLYSQEPEASARKVDHRWYLVYKYPNRSKFANKDRGQQNALLRYPEEWAYLCEALYAAIVFKMIRGKNILTDYTLTRDRVCLTDGKRTAMIRNFKCHENNMKRGQIQLSQDPWFHGHRNTVPFVVIKV